MSYLGLILIIGTLDISSPDWWEETYSNAEYLISSPSRWDKEDWLASAFIISACGGIMTKDEKIQDWIQGERSSASDHITQLIEPFGAEGAILGLAGLYIGGCLIQDTALKKIALLGAKSAIISSVIVTALKVLIGRARPYTDEGAFSYSLFNIYASHQSLPSGHTSTAFAIASCLAEECENPLAKIVSYGAAVLVGLSRIHDDKHWASDVFLGSAIGIGVGRTVSKLR